MKINESFHTEEFQKKLYDKITSLFTFDVPYERINSFEISNYVESMVRVICYHSNGCINHFDFTEKFLLDKYSKKHFESWYNEEIRKIKIDKLNG